MKPFVILSFLLISVSSFAGYYSVSYSSGGTAIYRGDTYYHSLPYSQFGGGVTPYSPDVTASFTEEVPDYPEQVVTQVAECSGAITATFTWHPDNPSDLPPKVAILKEYGFARWDAPLGAGLESPGFADNGLGNAENTDGQTYGQSLGAKYTVVSNPGQQWSLPTPRNPRVKGVSSWGWQWGPTTNARLTYTSALYPVWINTTNTVNSGGLIFAEASRQTNAYLTCDLPDSHFDPDSFIWSASGQLVKNYSPTTASAHPIAMGAADWQQPSPTWHYFASGQSTINCQVRIWTDDGLLNETISTSKDLTVEKVEVGGTTAFSELTKIEDWIPFLYTNTNPSVAVGDTMVGMVYSVTPGASAIADHFPPGGALVDTQLILAQWNVNFIEKSTNGEFWLDNSFPYANAGNIFQTPGGAINAYLDGSDSPHFGGTWGSVIVSTTFEMHLLYKASPSGSIWIPASRFLWTWNAAGPGDTQGQPDGYGIVDNIAFPEWDDVFENTGGDGESLRTSVQSKGKQGDHAK